MAAEKFPELVVRSFADLADAFRAVQGHLKISNECLEQVCGMCPGFIDKLLGPSREKRIGPTSFDLLLGGLGLELVVRPDPKQMQKITTRLEHRNEKQVRWEAKPLTKEILDRARPIIVSQIIRDIAQNGWRRSVG